MPDFTALRRDFPILSQEIGGRRLVYLDSAATAQVPLPVLEQQINAYIESPMSATTIREMPGRKGGEEVTSELIYYWMIAHNIPFECQKWHLNRLLTLIRICNIKSQPAKKQSRREILSQNAALNAARRKQLNSKG